MKHRFILIIVCLCITALLSACDNITGVGTGEEITIKITSRVNEPLEINFGYSGIPLTVLAPGGSDFMMVPSGTTLNAIGEESKEGYGSFHASTDGETWVIY